MRLKIDIIDAFTDKRFKGNAAAVIFTKDWLPDSLMQSIAAENNLSETAFLVQKEEGSFDIRWFSPLCEVDFCGHATLASAWLIFNRNPSVSTIQLCAKAVGEMCVPKSDDGYLHMDFPNKAPTPVDSIPSALLDGLSISPTSVLKNQQAYFAIYENEEDVRSVRTTNAYLTTLAPRDVVVTAPGREYDFVSRYFWPANGGDEDPVTGSIHTGLAPYWSHRLNKSRLLAYQASSRGGIVQCELVGDRVIISGKAVHYLSGSIEV